MGSSPTATSRPKRHATIGVRCKPDYLSYLARLAVQDRAYTMSVLLDRAVESYAQSRGYPAPPARR